MLFVVLIIIAWLLPIGRTLTILDLSLVTFSDERSEPNDLNSLHVLAMGLYSADGSSGESSLTWGGEREYDT